MHIFRPSDKNKEMNIKLYKFKLFITDRYLLALILVQNSFFLQEKTISGSPPFAGSLFNAPFKLSLQEDPFLLMGYAIGALTRVVPGAT